MPFLGTASGILSHLPFARSLSPTTHHAKPSKSHSPAAFKVDARLADAQPASSSPPSSIPPSWPSEAALRGAFGSTEPRQQLDLDLSVTGRLPQWLSGIYLRNGPGTYENGTAIGMNHMFDGYAMILKLDIDGESNKVKLSHKFVESEAYKTFRKTGKMGWREFATPVPTEGLFEKVKDVASMAFGSLGIGQGVTDNASVNILPQGDKVWATTETTAGTYVIDPSTLSTLGRVEYADSLKGDLTTAHPTVLPYGDVINLLSVPVLGFSVYRQTTEAATGKPSRKKIASVSHKHPLSPAWIHDFPGSKKHVIIPETPLYFNLGSLMLGGNTDHIFLDWVPEEGTRLHVVNIEDGSTRQYTAPAFFTFHWANAFESDDGQYLFIDGAVYDDPEIVNHLDLKNVKNFSGPSAGPTLPKATLRRLKIDLQASPGSHVSGDWEDLMDDNAAYGNFVEFPCVNPVKKGESAQFVWGTAAVQPTNVNNSLVKFDLLKRKSTLWHEPGGIVGEPLFIPAPGASEEDDGVVIAVVTQPDGKATLLVLDGKSHSEIARAPLPYGVTNGFHGAFIPADK